jgi:hypothetical protein
LVNVACRENKELTQDEASAALKKSLTALDSLLATVPEDIMQRCAPACFVLLQHERDLVLCCVAKCTKDFRLRLHVVLHA